MSIIDYSAIIIFTIVIVVAGLSFRKRGSDMKSYFAAGGEVPWSISGLSLFMSFFSAGTFVVWGSIAYQMGIVSVIIQLTMCIGGFVVAYYIAPAWKRTNNLTAAEFVRERLGGKTQKLYTYIILILSLAYTGAFLYPVAKIVNVSTGFPIEACVVTLGLLILLYTVVGGLWAVIITDVLQFVILTAAVVIVVILSIDNVGGITSFIERAPEHFFDTTGGDYNWSFMASFAIYNAIFIGGNWAYVQRYTSVKSTRDAKRVGLTFGWLYLLSPIVWMLPPMIYKVVNPDLVTASDIEGAYLLACKEVLPVGILGLMIGGMIFATASSVNTTLNLAASVITNDIYRVIKPKASNRSIMRVAKLSTLLFGIGTIIVALLVPSAGGIVTVVLSISAVTGCSIYGPPLWALFSKRHSGKSIISITVISLLINVAVKFLAEPIGGEVLSRSNEMLLGALLPLSMLALYELYAYIYGNSIVVNSDRSSVSDSSDSLDSLGTSSDILESSDIEHRDSENESESQNLFGLKVLGVTLGVVGLLVIILGIISDDSRVLVTSVGGVVVLVGLFVHPKFQERLKR